VIELARALALETAASGADPPDHCVVIGHGERRVALLVDSVVGTEEIVLEPLGGVLRRVRGIAGATILSSGAVCPVLAANDLIKADLFEAPGRSGSGCASMPASRLAQGHRDSAVGETEPRYHLLLVEDSMLTRVQEKRLLESAGYRVSIAVDGMEALERLRAPPAQAGTVRSRQADRFDAVITDVNMPRMDGLRLTEQIRADPRLRALPVVLVTSLASEADQRRGLEAGASAYITKGGFDNRLLLSTLERLL
jgi:two-component system chemotaxis sensor kinase CheA